MSSPPAFTQQTGQGATVLDVLKAGDCSPSCLLSQDTGRCHCKCQGRHHGALMRYITTAEQPPAARSRAGGRRRARRRT